MSGAVQSWTLRPAAFLAIAGSAAAGPLFKDLANVVELVPDTFNSTVLASRIAWVVDFYADWCPHCIHFAPVWDQVAGMFRAEKLLRFGALNCAAYGEFCSAIDVGSFPTMRSYHFPGSNASYTRRGSDLHEGEYRVYEESELVALIRSKLAALKGTGFAFDRTQGKYCSKAAATVLSAFPANSTGAADAERSRDACEVFCLGKTGCWGCSAYCSAGKCGWSALPDCGLTLDFGGAIKGGVSRKRALPAPPAATTSTTPPPTLKPVAAPPSVALRWRDAEVALQYALRQGTALAAGPDGMLQGEALEELAHWVYFLSRALPSARARSRLTVLTVLAADGLRQPERRLARADWLKALDAEAIDQVPVEAGADPTQYWEVCRTYTCGLWTLFHIATVAAGEAAVGSSAPSGGSAVARRLGGSGALVAPPSPQEALTRIRGFVAHFFGCADCVRHFLRTYDSCDFGICRLRPDDGPGAALWLWQVHNAVAKRVAAEAGRKAPPPWPSVDQCAECWEPGGSGEPRWHSQPVYAFLVLSYWPSSDQADATIGAWDSLRPVLSGASGLLWPAVLLAVVVLIWLGHRRKKVLSVRCAQGSESFLSYCEDGSSDTES